MASCRGADLVLQTPSPGGFVSVRMPQNFCQREIYAEIYAMSSGYLHNIPSRDPGAPISSARKYCLLLIEAVMNPGNYSLFGGGKTWRAS
jgi:hypothetical protein